MIPLTSLLQPTSSYTLNPVTSLSATILNSVTAVSILNPVTAVNIASSNVILPISGSVTILNSVTSLSAFVINPVTAVTILNPVTALNVTNTIAISTTQTFSVSVVNPQIEITNDIGNPIPINTTQTLPVSGSVTVTTPITSLPSGIQLVSNAPGYQLDQTGRARTAVLGQQWWYNSTTDKDGDYRMIESFTSTATSIYVQNYASTLMTSGTANGATAIRTSRRRHKLRPGVGMQYFGTWCWDGYDTNVVKRKGWYTNYNGMFFELSGGDMNAVVRMRLMDGTLLETRVPRSQFNGDKIDGNGPSGENWNLPALSAYTTNTITPTVTAVSVGSTTVWNVRYSVTNAAQASAFLIGSKVTVNGFTPFTFNGPAIVQSYNTATPSITLTYPLSVGNYSAGASTGNIIQTAFHGTHTYWLDIIGDRTNQVRFGKVTDKGEVILHTMAFDGQFGSPYSNAPAMPVRKEIYNTGTVNYNPTISMFGCSINVEASVELNPYFSSVYNNTPINCNLNQEVVILGVGQRFGEPWQRGDIQVQSIGIQDTANPPGKNANNSIIFWRLLLNPGLSGMPTSVNTGKSIQYWPCTSTTGLTGSQPSGYANMGGGWELLTGYAQSGDTINVNTQLNFLNLGSNIQYTDADKIFLTGRIITAGGNTPATLVANMNVIESL